MLVEWPAVPTGKSGNATPQANGVWDTTKGGVINTGEHLIKM